MAHPFFSGELLAGESAPTVVNGHDSPPLPTSHSQGFNGVAKGISEEGIAVMMVYIGCCIGWDWSPSPG
ncbi:Alpha/Beta hydrolase fold-containing protein [Dioscorea alata]|uniref:Alpha/Beta hydrolase fold-containing protein n=1 Tax=Dioscorea alata TaxID=55571 RepID=A0ACB7W453_DIOAL|nr:Alpha/Beta hydrolase fold-containing protein [Dioscorea alata]